MATDTSLPGARTRTRVLGTALSAAVAAVLPALPVLPAAPAVAAPSAVVSAAVEAAEVYQVPDSRVLQVQGHGFGHGRGMSQWGSQGAATLGVSAATILSTYYPGSVGETRTSGSLRVALTRAGVEGRRPTAAGAAVDGRYECDRTSPSREIACLLEVLPAAGQTAQLAGAAPVALPTTTAAGPVLRWRVLNDDAGMHLQHLVGTAWTTFAATATGPVTFDGPAREQAVRYASNGAVHVYRGTVSAVRVSGTRSVRVNTVPLEAYLRSVVPKESPASWLPAALQAQSVAARSYSMNARSVRAGQAWEVCDSTSCQVYAGRSVTAPGGRPVGQEAASTDAAITATAGQVRTYGGRVLRTEFSASNGGWSTSGDVPWLQARADPWDGAVPHSSHSWSAELPASALETRFGLGRLDALAVLSRDGNGEWGGRVLDVELRGLDRAGVPTTVRTTGRDVLLASPVVGPGGLRSAWFRPGHAAPADLARGAWAAADGSVALAARTAPGSASLQTWSPTAGRTASDAFSGTLRGAPAVVARRSGPLEVFARGTDDALWTRTRTATGWTSWTSLGGILRSRPTAARGAGDDLHVLVTGRDGRVWQRSSSAPGTWSAWTSIGGSPAPGTAPAAVATSSGRLDVVVHGTDGRVSWRRAQQGVWGAWRDLGGTAAGDPAVASAAGELTVVVRTPDGRAATRTTTAADTWRSLGGVLVSDPAAAAALGSGRVDLFVTGSDGRLWRKARTSTGWSSWQRAT